VPGFFIYQHHVKMKRCEIAPVRMSDIKRTHKMAMLVAGPCSAESEDQLMRTASLLMNSGVDYFRAGLWKPRTRPGNFEGVGEAGIEWMLRVKRETGLKIVTEVANRSHVENVLRAGFDAVWIGARTTANPFSVQEIADALRGSDVTVFIKNPVNPDIDLWIGAIERIRNAGITTVIAVHRGFSPFGSTKYRNMPVWRIAEELMEKMPETLLICDPSHIAGNKDLVQEVTERALSIGMGGLFVEAHWKPEEARSDRDQQITPAELNTLLKLICELPVKEPAISEPEELALLRGEIDCWDKKLLVTLRNRMNIASLIGEFKKRSNYQIVQNDRWNEVINARINDGMELGLSEGFLLRLFEQIHGESINFQKRIGE